MEKEEFFKRINEINFKKGTFSDKTRNLILEEEFNKPLDSKQFIEMYNDGYGRNIKIIHLTALMQPLLREEIVKTKSLKDKKKKIKLWFPAWMDKKEMNFVNNLNFSCFYPEITKVSEKLFVNEHYPEAIEAAFKKVIDLVKKKSGRNDLDGFPLMSTVFSKDNPILKFNNLLSRVDKDEQQGWMHLYQGAVLGIRNVKVHKEVKQNDPIKTLEYLSFASLLCKRLDETIKNELK